MKRHARRAGFTLIELLVTIALVAILAALALSAMGAARIQGDRAKAISNMRQIGSAITGYSADKDSQLPGPLWPGQLAEFDPARAGRLVRELAPYLGFETPAKPTVIDIFMPPAYRRITPASSLSTARTFVMNMAVSSGNSTINPWGSLVNPSDTGPLRLGNIPSTAWGFSEADRQHPRVVGASWAANTPAEPIHKKRLAWFFNGSVSPIETIELQ
jgi:prepilin-type N-terminal cleavage/methylation domain-containing protein